MQSLISGEDRKKKVYIENLGCAKNQVDAETMLGYLESDGWSRVDDAANAELVVVNTCSFIEAARKESIDAFFSLKARCPDAKVVMTGCLAQRYADSLAADLPEADGIFGNRDLTQVLPFVRSVLDGARPVRIPDHASQGHEFVERMDRLGYPGSSYVKISEGCNHTCAFCAIPGIRGPLVSRSMEDVLAETRSLISDGVREINLIAQDLASFGVDNGGKSRFCDLVESIAAVPGNFFVRLLYIYPDAYPRRLTDIIAASEGKILPYFDLPFQHAAVPVLRAMGRAGTPESYLALIDSIRSRIPQAVFRSTFMLGFPGENRAEFDVLLDFLKDARLDWVGSFIYSREEGTSAWDMRGETAHRKAVKQAALWQQELIALQEEITFTRLERFVGTVHDVLLEEKVEGEDLYIGRMYAQAPDVDGLTVVMGRDMVPGTMVKCGITRRNGLDLEAVPVSGRAQ
ncbi:30S ribosomal protein S12 methylthiotransferase RimO [Parasphaerochaeta coccoides]|uniref:Ribosomal protein uS12 methylthiotransferase RimO n=1 Tax=Parasphaerochaeta coccoides (strain ATCC BAA-1237 / DSM 17374 / SPN1) TaxID=760011 RepID=F4GLL4_PARC1|nr:30S ribosomal protein S12 methylthiotransferase RimO [Parasphaerochaeta coccoides]AEC02408.1 Ribosomal protein S12 methylthiotransferase rimO [Parasphaerochaeta coccoides DSM 17374]